eukprot:PhF_6_TR39026/c0_g1_i1/m.58409
MTSASTDVSATPEKQEQQPQQGKGIYELWYFHRAGDVQYWPGAVIWEHCFLRCIQGTCLSIIPAVCLGTLVRGRIGRQRHRAIDWSHILHRTTDSACGAVALGMLASCPVLWYVTKGWNALDVRQRYLDLSLNEDQGLWMRCQARGVVFGTVGGVVLLQGNLIYRAAAGIGGGSLVSALASFTEFDKTLAW